MNVRPCTVPMLPTSDRFRFLEIAADGRVAIVLRRPGDVAGGSLVRGAKVRWLGTERVGVPSAAAVPLRAGSGRDGAEQVSAAGRRRRGQTSGGYESGCVISAHLSSAGRFGTLLVPSSARVASRACSPYFVCHRTLEGRHADTIVRRGVDATRRRRARLRSERCAIHARLMTHRRKPKQASTLVTDRGLVERQIKPLISSAKVSASSTPTSSNSCTTWPPAKAARVGQGKSGPCACPQRQRDCKPHRRSARGNLHLRGWPVAPLGDDGAVAGHKIGLVDACRRPVRAIVRPYVILYEMDARSAKA
jgi:hypothetical protein